MTYMRVPAGVVTIKNGADSKDHILEIHYLVPGTVPGKSLESGIRIWSTGLQETDRTIHPSSDVLARVYVYWSSIYYSY